MVNILFIVLERMGSKVIVWGVYGGRMLCLLS